MVRKPVKRRRNPLGVDPQFIETLESRRLLSSTLHAVLSPNIVVAAPAFRNGIEGYTPSQISTAYGFNQVTIDGVAGNGAGQTIAIVDAYNDPNIASDVGVFDQQFGLPAINLTAVNQAGGSPNSVAINAGWATETSLDVEWAHAMAPAADILLVETNNDNLSSLMAGVGYARNVPAVSVLSMSWGGSEFGGESAYDGYFTTPVGHQGITFIAAAGDDGSSAAEWPASSPNVMGVGGTTLNLANNAGTYGSETAWYDSGGGQSTVENEPNYQQDAQTTGLRDTPDVAYDANPNTGVAVYDSIPDEGYVGWQEIGGTSEGSPQWAAIIAIADQGRIANGGVTLDGPTGTLPTLYGLYNPPTSSAYSSYTVYFNAIPAPRSGPGGPGNSGAGPGYDTVTGLGTPKVPAVVAALDDLTSRAAAKALRAAHLAHKLAKLAKLRGRGGPGDQHPETPGIAFPSHEQSPQTGFEFFTPISVAPDTTFAPAPAPSNPSSLLEAAIPLAQPTAPAPSAVTPGSTSSGSWFVGLFATSESQALATFVPSSAADAAVGSFETGEVPMLAAAEALPQVVTREMAAPLGVMLGDSAAALAAPAVEMIRFNPATAFVEASAAFAEECAAIPVLSVSHPSRAWAITAAVLGLDAVLIGYWYAHRPATRKAQRSARISSPT